MYPDRVGENLRWAWYRRRERLDFTDPPPAPGPSRPPRADVGRGVLVVLATVAITVAITAAVRADTAPSGPRAATSAPTAADPAALMSATVAAAVVRHWPTMRKEHRP
jgi:hypothetical protein